ncbi:MAG: restriction endonuclease subunit S [Treponema sp.]|nr:restriction endonuclease subunit S [Treponema sp.]
MAKKENCHAEHFDKLSASLVSASANIEAPYELPDGWKWEKISNLSDIYTGNSINETVKKEKYTGIKEGLNFIGTKDVDFDGTINYENGVKISDYENFKTVPANTPLLCIEGGSAGKKLGITSEQVCFGNKLCAFVCKNVEPKLVYYYLQTNAFFYSFMKERHGLIGGVSVGTLKNIPFPLPPTLAEQKRIVNRIETMFAKLDEAKEKAQNVVDSFETRKAAILHKAFTGQLKIDNEELSIEDWEEKKLGEVCESIFDGDHMPPPKAESGIPFLVISNVNTGFLSFDNTRYVPNDYYDSLSETRKPKTGDVLYTIVGSYGIPVLVDSDRAFCFQRHMALLKPSKLISSRYLWYVLQSNEMYQKATSIATGTAQLTVPIKGLRELTIPVPPLNYQLSIVNFLNTVLEKESRAKEAAQTVLDQIALLKKSILARAFRGEL